MTFAKNDLTKEDKNRRDRDAKFERNVTIAYLDHPPHHFPYKISFAFQLLFGIDLIFFLFKVPYHKFVVLDAFPRGLLVGIYARH